MSVRAAVGVTAGGAAAATLAYVLLRRRSPSPEVLQLTLIGFGAVNKALARLIHANAEMLRAKHNLVVVYRAIVARHGAWEAQPGYELDAASVAALADAVASGAAKLDGSTSPPQGVAATSKPTVSDIRGMISRTPAYRLTCLAEAIDVDYDRGEPATTYIADALARGAHCVSANKGPVVHHRARLLALASKYGVRYLHESAVMDGVPIFSLWRGGFLPGGAKLLKFRGCLNATTCVVLSGMARGVCSPHVSPHLPTSPHISDVCRPMRSACRKVNRWTRR